jgi:D-arabinose 1-dehydrogenase-like Zn-dependent alcohol dehydrogenase
MQKDPEKDSLLAHVLADRRYAGVCYTDVHETLGHLPGAFPRILGHEPVGEIVSANRFYVLLEEIQMLLYRLPLH